jgi:hypothetical protein
MMTLKMRFLAGAVALALGTTAAMAATPAQIDSQFRAAVGRVLNSVKGTNDYLSSMSASDFRAFVKCAQNVMDATPRARKQYVLAAKNAGEQRTRFDEVSLDNRAKLKQQITRDCTQ